LGQKTSSNEEAALLLEQYLEAETEHIEDNYFPDEIEAMLSEKCGAAPLYEQHYDDYLLDSEQQPRVDYSKEHPKNPPIKSGEKP